MAYNPKSYWEERLKQNFTLKGVGHISFNENYNRSLYRLKSLALDRAFKTIHLNLRGKSILDLGCGTGFFASYYEDKGINEYMGIDITEISVKNLRKRYIHNKKLSFLCKDISDLDFLLGKKYDIANAFDVLYHIVDPAKFEAALTNIASVMKPGSYLILTDRLDYLDERVADHVIFRSYRTYDSIFLEIGLKFEKIVPLYCLMNRNSGFSISLARWPGLMFPFDKMMLNIGYKTKGNLKIGIIKKDGVSSASPLCSSTDMPE